MLEGLLARDMMLAGHHRARSCSARATSCSPGSPPARTGWCATRSLARARAGPARGARRRVRPLARRLAAGAERPARARRPAHPPDVDPPGAAPAVTGRDAAARPVLAPRGALGARDPGRDRAAPAAPPRAARPAGRLPPRVGDDGAAAHRRERAHRRARTAPGCCAASRRTSWRRSTGSRARPSGRPSSSLGAVPVAVVFRCEICGRRPGPRHRRRLERQLLDLRHGEYVDVEPDRWLVWHGRGIYGPTRYACGEHRGELKALLREQYGTLGWHPWAQGPHPWARPARHRQGQGAAAPYPFGVRPIEARVGPPPLRSRRSSSATPPARRRCAPCRWTSRRASSSACSARTAPASRR